MQQRVDDVCAQSLAVYAFPCPPLPVFVFRETAGERDVVSSHDLVMTGMRAAMRVKSGEARHAQMIAQLERLQAYNSEMDALHAARGGEGVGALVYAAMQGYTRDTIALYTGLQNIDVVFAPADAASERLRAAAVQHLVLYRQLQDTALLAPGDVAHLRYEDLLLRFFKLYCEDGVREQAAEHAENEEKLLAVVWNPADYDNDAVCDDDKAVSNTTETV